MLSLLLCKRFLRQGSRFSRQFDYSLQCQQSHIMAKGCGVFGALGLGDDLLDAEKYQVVQVPLSNNAPTNTADPGDIHERRSQLYVSSGWGHSAMIVNKQLYMCGRPYDLSKLFSISKWYKFNKRIARHLAGSTNSMLFMKTLGYFPTPTIISGLNDVKDVACSAGLTICVEHSGALYSFGLNRWHQCGVRNEHENSTHVFQPTRIPNIPPCASVEVGLQHAIALTNDGEVFTWGKYDRGQLGVGDQEQSAHLPAKIKLGNKHTLAKQISAGFAHSAAVTEDGQLYIWGRGFSTEEKSSDPIRVHHDQFTPRLIGLPGGRRVSRVCCSNWVVVVVADDNSVWALGKEEYDRHSHCTPIRVETDFDLNDGKRVSNLEEEEGKEGDAAAAKANSSSTNRDNSNSFSNSKTNDRGSPLTIPPGTILKKGYNRVALIFPARIDGLRQLLFEVVLFQGEAYLQKLKIERETTASHNNNSESESVAFNVLDYSAGWQHSMVVVEELPVKPINWDASFGIDYE